MPGYALALVWHRPFALPFVEGQLPLCGRRRGSQSMVAEAHLAGRASGRSAVLDPVGPGRVAEGALARSQPDSRPVRSETGAVPRDRTTSVRAHRRRSSWLDEASASPALPVPPRGTSAGRDGGDDGIIPVLARAVREVEAAAKRGPVKPVRAHQVPGRRSAGARGACPRQGRQDHQPRPTGPSSSSASTGSPRSSRRPPSATRAARAARRGRRRLRRGQVAEARHAAGRRCRAGPRGGSRPPSP